MGRIELDPPALNRTEPPAGAAEKLALAMSLALVLALWRSGAHLVPAPGAVWRGYTDLPGPGRLALAVVLAVAFAFWLARRPAAVRRPFLLLSLVGAPALAVQTGHLDMALALQGPALVPLVAAVLGVALVRSRESWWPGTSARISRATRSLREKPTIALFLSAAAFYALLGTRLPGPAGPQGDEPHYLIMAESLLSDGDLDLADEFAHRDYRAFFAGRLEAHASPASPKGSVYPVHAPGLAALILPAYAVGGYPAVRFFLGLIAALTGVLVHRLVRETIGRDDLAWIAWAAFTFTPPLPFLAVAVYPEIPAALATAALLLASRPGSGGGRLAWAVGATAVLPWLHPKFLPLAVAGLGLVLLRPIGMRARLLATLTGAVSLVLLLAFFHAVYGRASLAAAYGPGFAQDLTLARIPRGVAALFLDRQFGLFAIGPLWLLAIPGGIALLRFRTGAAVRTVLLAGAVIAVSASFSMWWGGACPPARFLIPALPALALLLAPALPARRDAAAALFAIGLAIVALAADAPRAIHNRPDGESGLLRFLAPSLDLDRFLPSFVGDDPSRLPVALTLLAALALAYRFRTRGLLWGALAHGLVASALTPSPLLDARRATLRLIEAWDPASMRPVSSTMDPSGLVVPLDLRGEPWTVEEGEAHLSGRLDLPPGRYRLDVDYRALAAPARSRTTRLDLEAGTVLVERFYLEQALPRMSFPLLLPVGARRLTLTARGVQGTVHIERIVIAPEILIPRGDRSGLTWPRPADDESYRVGAGQVRATPLDGSPRVGDGFRIEAGEERFVIDAPADAGIEIQIRRDAPSEEDTLQWGDRLLHLGRLGDVRLELAAAESNLRLGPTTLVPVRVHASGAAVSFAETGRR